MTPYLFALALVACGNHENIANDTALGSDVGDTADDYHAHYIAPDCALVTGITVGAPRPPRAPHVVEAASGERLLVFSRSEDDNTCASNVSEYSVTVGDIELSTTANYVVLPDEAAGIASVQTLTPEGLESVAVEVDLDAPATYVLGAPILPDPADLLMHGPLPWSSYSTPPTTVYSPVYGPLTVLGTSATTNRTSGPWSFWQHKSGYHRAGGGVYGSDDTYAWDINLNVNGAYSDGDRNMNVVPVGFGWVRTWGGKGPGGNGAGEVLIDHSGWWSAYLHMLYINARTGDYMTPSVIMGKIGNAGKTDNYHLHLVTYTGTNTWGGLKSYNVNFIMNPVSIQFVGLSPTYIARGSKKLLSAKAYLTNHCASDGTSGCTKPSTVDLNPSAVYANTWWKSSNASVASVDGYGNVTGRAAGSATITVYFSGTSRSISVRVP